MGSNFQLNVGSVPTIFSRDRGNIGAQCHTMLSRQCVTQTQATCQNFPVSCLSFTIINGVCRHYRGLTTQSRPRGKGGTPRGCCGHGGDRDVSQRRFGLDWGLLRSTRSLRVRGVYWRCVWGTRGSVGVLLFSNRRCFHSYGFFHLS